MREEKLISVIMGVHNSVTQFEAAIESVINQTYSNWEFIICDDGSVDGSFEKLQEKYGENEKFILLKNESNMGLAATLNHCLEYCKGDYIARMDDDDINYPTRFEKQLDFLHKHPEISFVSSSIDLFDGQKIIGNRKLIEYPTKKNLIWNSPFVHPATIFRAADLKRVRGYRISEETIRGQDYDLFMRMYAKGYKGANLQEVVYRYTVAENNLKRRTFKARLSEITIRRKGYSAMGVMPWASPMLLKPIVAHFVMGIYNKIWRRGY